MQFFVARRGQSLVTLALVLPFLVLLVLGVVEIGARQLTKAEVEDALRQSARSAVQQFDYQALADNREEIRPQRVQDAARAALIQNLSYTRGLTESPESLANRVTWRVHDGPGGSCTLNGQSQTFSTPVVCASVTVTLRGLLPLWDEGRFQTTLTAVSAIDLVARPTWVAEVPTVAASAVPSVVTWVTPTATSAPPTPTPMPLADAYRRDALRTYLIQQRHETLSPNVRDDQAIALFAEESVTPGCVETGNRRLTCRLIGGLNWGPAVVVSQWPLALDPSSEVTGLGAATSGTQTAYVLILKQPDR